MSTIRTYTSKLIDLTAIAPSDIDIVDIAHSLSNLCRFNGHSRKFYSVAQHSCWVAAHCPPEYKLEGLLHDAAEAYIGDVTRPLKQLLGEPYKQLEQSIELAIALRFGLTYPWPDSVKDADNLACRCEQITFWDGTTDSQTGEVRRAKSLSLHDRITPRPLPKDCFPTFLPIFHQLQRSRHEAASRAESV